jgi:hypothetical protein
VGEDKKKRGMKMGWILLIISQLTSQIVSRFIESMDLIDPEGFMIKMVKPERETDEEA